MEVKDYESLKHKLCKELEEIKERKNMGMAEIEIIDKLTHAIKNIEYIMDQEEGGSSYRGRSYGRRMSSYDDGMHSYNNSYGDDSSYARGRHYVRGHYSYADDMADITERLEELMDSNNLSLDDKSIIKKAMNIMRK